MMNKLLKLNALMTIITLEELVHVSNILTRLYLIALSIRQFYGLFVNNFTHRSEWK